MDNLTVVYKNGTVGLDSVSLTMDKGEFVFVTGRSGSGKTTLFKSISGETLDISTGGILVNKYSYRECSRKALMEARRAIGMIFQDYRLIQSMTVDENLEFAMRCVGASGTVISKRITEVLEMVDLPGKADAYPAELSGGEQQRVAIARAIINSPSLIIADEPTGDLDNDMAHQIMELLVRINEDTETTALVITHATELVSLYNKRHVVMDAGKLSEAETQKTILEGEIPVRGPREHATERRKAGKNKNRKAVHSL